MLKSLLDLQDFHEKLRAGFLDIAGKEPDRVKIIDASKESEAISAEIMTIALGVLKDK